MIEAPHSSRANFRLLRTSRGCKYMPGSLRYSVIKRLSCVQTRAHDLGHVNPGFERTGLGRIVRRLPPRVGLRKQRICDRIFSVALLAILAGVTGVPPACCCFREIRMTIRQLQFMRAIALMISTFV